ncbi:SsgA family sporulation/cell division regulator [Streptomyces fumanus]|uniref:SsgA family sporulation/cell division regulator n=1 Tax=Streptomyces fumanus TaxID=67302 RepID=UPI0033EA5A05
MPVVEEYARVHVLTDADAPDGGDGPTVPVVLRYDPGGDPRAVRIALPGRGPGARVREFVFARELLERGLRGPAGTGEVRVWPCGRVQTVVEFHSAHGCSVVQFDAKALIRFLDRTYAVAAQPVAR